MCRTPIDDTAGQASARRAFSGRLTFCPVSRIKSITSEDVAQELASGWIAGLDHIITEARSALQKQLKQCAPRPPTIETKKSRSAVLLKSRTPLRARYAGIGPA
jgi:hypothetical protein